MLNAAVVCVLYNPKDVTNARVAFGFAVPYGENLDIRIQSYAFAVACGKEVLALLRGNFDEAEPKSSPKICGIPSILF